MSYTALYRKFRPDTFEDVKGQGHIVRTLKNQIQSDRIGHAYLFTGTRGTGKTTVAKIFAKTVNCEHPAEGNPCGECSACKSIAAGSSMNVIEIDAASNNGVDNIREIVDEVSYSPAEGKYKVYIIDEVHMLSIGAFNALLKTLEEPPSYVIFILATTEVHKLPITILSRCQRYDFKRISIDTISDRLQELMKLENVSVEERAVRFIAKTADGSMRDALSLLDQCIAFHLGKELTYDMALDVLGAVDTQVFSQMLRMVIEKNILGAVELLEEIVMQGRELSQFVTEFTWYLRNLMLVKASTMAEDVIDVSTENLARLEEEAEMLEMHTILRYIRIFSELSGQLRYAGQKRILIEMAIIKLCKPEMEADKDSILDRVRAVEEKLEQGIVVQGSMPFTENAAAIEQTETGQTAKAIQMPKAIPEDVEQIVKKWSAVINSAAMPMKMYLKSARLSLGGDNKLVVVVPEGMAASYFLEQADNADLHQIGHKEQLEALLSNMIGKTVEITIQVIAKGDKYENSYVDLSKLIQMDIDEVEEEEPEGFF